MIKMIAKIETERSHLFDVSMLIAMRIHIQGEISEADIRSAFEKAVRSHEVLQCHIVIGEDGTAYYEKNVSSDMPEGYHNNTITFETDSWENIIRREEKHRFRLEEGEFLKAFCYETDAEGCSILFLMHHLGGDGLSLVYFIESFMKALSGEEPQYREFRNIPAGDMDKKALSDRIGPLALLPKFYNSKWGKDEKKQAFGFEDMDRAYEMYWQDRQSVINEYVIRPQMVSHILKRCREWNVHFTAYALAAFLRRMNRKCVTALAVDAREDQNRSMGNQATGITVKYAFNYNKSFKENVIKIQKLMDDKLEDDGAREFILPFMAAFEPTLVDAISLEHVGTFDSKTSKSLAGILGYGKNKRELSITNLTKLPIPETYGLLKLDFFSFIPPVVSNGKNIVGLSTLGDCTVMTLHRVKKTDDLLPE